VFLSQISLEDSGHQLKVFSMILPTMKGVEESNQQLETTKTLKYFNLD